MLIYQIKFQVERIVALWTNTNTRMELKHLLKLNNNQVSHTFLFHFKSSNFTIKFQEVQAHGAWDGEMTIPLKFLKEVAEQQCLIIKTTILHKLWATTTIKYQQHNKDHLWYPNNKILSVITINIKVLVQVNLINNNLNKDHLLCHKIKISVASKEHQLKFINNLVETKV